MVDDKMPAKRPGPRRVERLKRNISLNLDEDVIVALDRLTHNRSDYVNAALRAQPDVQAAMQQQK